MTDIAAAPHGPMRAVTPQTDERPAKRPHAMINEPTGASLDATVSFSAVHDWWQVRNTGDTCPAALCCVKLRCRCGAAALPSSAIMWRTSDSLRALCVCCGVQGVRLSLQQAEMDLAGRQQQMVAVEVCRRDSALLFFPGCPPERAGSSSFPRLAAWHSLDCAHSQLGV